MSINEVLVAIALIVLAGTIIDIAYNYKKTFKE